jgi:autotransporter strand-loop-strand O-heptosyltransferase
VTDWLIENGYEPVIISREEDGYMGNPNPTGAVQLVPGPLDSVIHELSECRAFIGISSGLTWLAWITNTPTIQISGFTEPFNEPDNGIIKISAPAGSCSGCANRERFDPGDWNWCPDQKGTSRQFECSKLISADQVIAKLKEILI